MSDIDETLASRQQQYGDYAERSRVTQNIKRAMRDSVNWVRLTDDQRETLENAAGKIGRLLNGDAEHYDSWHDIEGYVRLSSDLITKRAGAPGASPEHPLRDDQWGPL